jgi:hypothetical protein
MRTNGRNPCACCVLEDGSGVNPQVLGRVSGSAPVKYIGGCWKNFSRLFKNGASVRDPALRGSCKCSHISRYAALSKLPRALADGPRLVFQYPARSGFIPSFHVYLIHTTAPAGRWKHPDGRRRSATGSAARFSKCPAAASGGRRSPHGRAPGRPGPGF